MKKVVKTIGLALLLLSITGISQISYAFPGIIHAFDFELEPIYPLEKGVPITMKLAFTPHVKYRWCKTVTITIATHNYIDKLSESSWDIELDENYYHSTTFQVPIPNNDTTVVHLKLECQRLRETFKYYFVTTGDSVEYWNGNPRNYRPPPSKYKTNDPVRDTLTQEQLQTEYEVILNLKDPAHQKAAERILGPLPDSSLYNARRGYYKLDISLENLIRLADQPVGFEFTSPPPWSRKNRSPQDSKPQPPLPSHKGNNCIDAENLTAEQLLKEHEVILFLRDSTERKLVEQIIDSKLDSLQEFGLMRFYIQKMSLENFIEIKKHSIDANLFEPRQPWHKGPTAGKLF